MKKSEFLDMMDTIYSHIQEEIDSEQTLFLCDDLNSFLWGRASLLYKREREGNYSREPLKELFKELFHPDGVPKDARKGWWSPTSPQATPELNRKVYGERILALLFLEESIIQYKDYKNWVLL